MSTECRAVGVLEKGTNPAESSTILQQLAHLLRSLSFNYGIYSAHEVVLRVPLASSPAGTTMRFIKRLPAALPEANQLNPKVPNPFKEDPPERWDVRHEGPPIKGPILNDLPASMREITETACYGSTVLDFWKALGARQESELYREGNEYSILYQGYELKVVLAMLSVVVSEPGRPVVDKSQVRGLSGYLVDVSCRVPEGRHYEGANIIGAFGATLLPHVKLIRAEV